MACEILSAGLFYGCVALAEKCLDEFFRVEFGDVIGFFTEADEFYGDVELVFNGNNDTASSGAVELGQEYTSDVDCFGEQFCLRNSVLACCSVEDEKDLIRCAGDFSGHDIPNFCQLPHQVLFCVQSAGCVEDEKVGVSSGGSFAGIEGNGGRVGTGFVFYDLGADALRPDAELLDGGGTVSITGGDNDLFIILT